MTIKLYRSVFEGLDLGHGVKFSKGQFTTSDAEQQAHIEGCDWFGNIVRLEAEADIAPAPPTGLTELVITTQGGAPDAGESGPGDDENAEGAGGDGTTPPAGDGEAAGGGEGGPKLAELPVNLFAVSKVDLAVLCRERGIEVTGLEKQAELIALLKGGG